MSELVLTNARIVTPEAVVFGTVRIVDGVIAEACAGAVGCAAMDLEGDYLVPGLVELHTDVLERHAFPRPGVAWPPVAAALAYDAEMIAAGITTVLDSLAIGYVIDSGRRPRDPRPLVEAVSAARDASLLRADHFLHLRCEVSTEHVVEDFEQLAGDALVRLVSLMDHTPGQRQFVDVDKYREYNQGKYGLSDAQVEALIARRLDDQQRFGIPHRAAIVARCHERGHAIASHDDATAAHVKEALSAGAVIAEFPTTLDAAASAHDVGLAVLAGAPNLVCGEIALRQHPGRLARHGRIARHPLVGLRARQPVARRVRARTPRYPVAGCVEHGHIDARASCRLERSWCDRSRAARRPRARARHRVRRGRDRRVARRTARGVMVPAGVVVQA